MKNILHKLFTKHFYLSLGIMTIIAILLRFPFLSDFPPSMVQDEVGLGYSSISIAETGKDEWGISYPLVFKSFGDYKPPAFFYITALLYKIIGWNFALPRVTSAISGVFVVILGSLFFRKLFKSNEIGIIGGLILAVSPWTVHLSRMAIESNLGLAFFMAGLLFFSYVKEKKYFVILSALFFSLSTYSYHGYRFTIVLFLASLILAISMFNFKNIKLVLPELKLYGIILILSTLFSLPGFLSNGATNRLDQTLTFTSEEGLAYYTDQENDCHITLTNFNPSATFLCRLQYNKYTKPIIALYRSYSTHLSPEFLFFKGDLDAGRNPIGKGQLFIFLFPLWILGIISLFKNVKQNLLIFTGYFISLIPSTVSGLPHAIRLSVFIPFVIATILYGYILLEKYLKNKKILLPSFILLSLLFSGVFVLNYVTNTYAAHEGESTFLSYAKTITQLSHSYVQKGYVVYQDHDLFPEPHIYYAYWNKISPALAQESFGQVYTENSGFERPKQFGNNMYFEQGNIKSLTCDEDYTQSTLFITNDPQKINPLQLIQENTKTYTFAYVYDMDEIRSNKQDYLELCN